MLGSRTIGTRWLGSGRAQRDDYRELSARLEGQAGLQSDLPGRGRAMSASLSASSDLSADAKRIRGLSARMEASAGMGGMVGRLRSLSASLSGSSDLSGAVGRQRPLSARFQGTSNLSTLMTRARGLSARFQGIAGLAAQRPSRLRALSAKFAATAAVQAFLRAGRNLSARFAGTTALVAGVRKNIFPSPAGRRLIVPPKIRELPVPVKGRIVVFEGDDRDLVMKEREKRPADVVDYRFHLDRWFRTFPQDWITGVEVFADPGIEVGPGDHPEVEVVGSHRFVVWTGGGQSGEQYLIPCLVSTQRGRKEEIDFMLRVTTDG